MNLVETSQILLKTVKDNQDISDLLNQLSIIPVEKLIEDLETDNQKKTFWINIYNAFAIYLLSPDAKIILNPIKRKQFFTKKQIRIASCDFSFDEIEHRILRKSKIWWGRGYLNRCFIGKIERKLRVNTLDPRIHFALNCGGMGCPPIRFYQIETINEQLELATQAFLFSEANEIENTNSILISKLFNWYSGDFGGEKGIVSFLKKYNAISQKIQNPKIIYSEYSWDPWLK